MTTSDTFDMTPPSPTPPPSSPPSPPIRRLRRSRSDRIGAGVAGGLGEYFGVDPVLFRVLFATAAFFGGAGVLGYLLAWAAIPEDGTERAAIDGWVTSLRRRRTPFWVVAAIGAALLWAVAFSWWAPGPFFPVIAVVIVLVAIFGRRTRRDRVEPVSLQKAATTKPNVDEGRPEWVQETRRWMHESRQASRERRRRAFPVRISVLVTLALTITVLGIADAVSGIRLPVYFWVTFGIVGLGLLVGMVLRRTPWSMVPLLIPAVAGMIAFGNTHASLHDGVGQPDWTATSVSELRSDYRLAFGQGTLDLRSIDTVTTPHTVDITMGAGQAKIMLPKTLNAVVHANVRMGVITVDGADVADSQGGATHHTDGYDIGRTVVAPTGATGATVTINVRLADGNIDIDRR